MHAKPRRRAFHGVGRCRHAIRRRADARPAVAHDLL